MGLTGSSTGRKAAADFRGGGQGVTVALAGNPNVGKSTVFNALTNMHQHTGNWAGKTVSNAWGCCSCAQRDYTFVDLPGTYSLMAHSVEEELARDFICFGGAQAVVLVCDATCLERNMNLVLQTLEISGRALVCVNLMDEARRKGISLDLPLISQRLGVPVIGISARERAGRRELLSALDELIDSPAPPPRRLTYPWSVEDAVSALLPEVERLCPDGISPRWLCLRLIEGDEKLIARCNEAAGGRLGQLLPLAARERARLEESGIGRDELEDIFTAASVREGAVVCEGAVQQNGRRYGDFDRRLDKLLTRRWLGYPLMLLLLALVFYISLVGANYPSQWLSKLLFGLEAPLNRLFAALSAPEWLRGVVVDGAYRVLAWVVSVMLPPMAIFFPLFTLLEDSGYLPRIAYNLDSPFKRCRACGKQALTMCMGFGCNAAGVVGCRIIDSERERLLAVLTNAFVPCNGRFPTLIALLTMFFIGSAAGGGAGILSALGLTALIAFSIAASLLATRLLSATILKGSPSSFILELPPYRRPQIGRVIISSVFDRTLFVLGRAAAVAAPAGALLWVCANVSVGGQSLIALLSSFLDPLGRFMGLDGVILLAFILGFPANEIVFPIIIMIYTSGGSLTELGALSSVKVLLLQNGWSWVTALCMLIFTVMHWPCSTTLLTVKKETGSLKWTIVAALLPTAAGFVCCAIIAAIARLF